MRDKNGIWGIKSTSNSTAAYKKLTIVADGHEQKFVQEIFQTHPWRRATDQTISPSPRKERNTIDSRFLHGVLTDTAVRC